MLCEHAQWWGLSGNCSNPFICMPPNQPRNLATAVWVMIDTAVQHCEVVVVGLLPHYMPCIPHCIHKDIIKSKKE